MANRIPASILYYDREGQLVAVNNDPHWWHNFRMNIPGAAYRVMVYERIKKRPGWIGGRTDVQMVHANGHYSG